MKSTAPRPTGFAVGAALAGLAVMLGAFGAHALEERLTPDRLEVFETGARYQMFHALAMLAVSGRAFLTEGARRQVLLLFGVGIGIFAGTLYGIALLDLPILGAVTPLGGLCFIAGWIRLAIAAARGTQPR